MIIFIHEIIWKCGMQRAAVLSWPRFDARNFCWKWLWHDGTGDIIQLSRHTIIPPSYQIRKIAGCACTGNAGNVFPATDFKGNRYIAIPACNTVRGAMHAPWCMSGSLTRSGGENVPGIPGACATRNVMYLARDPSKELLLQLWMMDDHHLDMKVDGVRRWISASVRAGSLNELVDYTSHILTKNKSQYIFGYGR